MHIHVPKILGGDFEFANALLGYHDAGGAGPVAAQLLLRQIAGIPERRRPPSAAAEGCELPRVEAHDLGAIGRRFLSNGASAYIDLDHLELPLPPVRSAFDFNIASHAMVRIARRAQQAAQNEIDQLDDPDWTLVVLANNSDGLGHSYGSHMNFAVSRTAFRNLFDRKLHYLLLLASYQASSIVLTGQGKVGSENGAPEVDYQISQRADFLECLVAPQTTYRRPLVNSRDEAHCGEALGGPGEMRLDEVYARLHCIMYDFNLCHEANVIKAGAMQIVLTMIEAEQLSTSLILDDPVAAARGWSHDPALRLRVELVDGRTTTAVDLQRRFFEAAARFVEEGRCENIVPRAEEIIALWGATLDHLAARDFSSLAGSLDWVLKWQILEGVLAENPSLDWTSPEIKHLDHAYGNILPDEGLFWAMERSEIVRRLASDAEIEIRSYLPPEDTRAYAHANLLARAGSRQVESVAWDRITLQITDPCGWTRQTTVALPDPCRGGKCETESLFADDEHSLWDIAAALNEIAQDACQFAPACTSRQAGLPAAAGEDHRSSCSESDSTPSTRSPARGDSA